VIEQVTRCLQAKMIRHELYFYRTRNQAEIDLLIDGPFGLIPIEIKAGYNVDVKQLRTLSDFVKANDCPFGLVINNADEVRPISDRLLQVPARCL
jgi:predicted AAA+ superfamily ATPase